MYKKVITSTLTAILITLSTSGCATKEARIEPGKLQVTENSIVKTGKIANIVQLSEKEIPLGQDILSGLTGALIGSAVSGGDGELVASLIGMEAGEQITKDKYGKSIYKLTLSLDDKTVKSVYAKGGSYVVGKNVKVTIDKNSDKITSFIVTK